ncbi:MAG TPA: DUF4390 domain-containing protein [Vicinamibacterales bacterium]|nr:DUF4390 domain-containing protein [Vicinamibacterales bacterium]
MSRLSSNKWLCVWGTAIVCAAGIIAHAAQTLRIIPTFHDNQVLVSFEVQDGYTDDVRDAIASGLRTTFSYDVELRMVARLWVDPVVATAVVGVSDRYDNLTRSHTLTRTVDGREQDSITTESEATVRQWLTSLDKLPICRTTKLEPNRDYYVRVSARVLPYHTSMLGWTSAIVGRTPFTFVP